MAIDLHTVSVMGGSDPLAFTDRLHFGKFTTGYVAGSGAGAAVNTPVAINLPPNAAFVLANVPAGVTASVTQAATGFTLTTSPANTANTLAAGSLAVLVFA